MADPTDYNVADFIPEGHSYFARWADAAAAFREGHGRARLDIPYGAHPREAFDLFLPDGPPKGLFAFIHGGFWRLGDRTLWSHLAAGPLAAGWAVALPSYPLCPEVRVAEITRSISRALPTMAGAVAGPILLAGHSAGGHLALRMLCPDAGLPEEVAARLRGVLAISPLVDLAPLIEMEMNADLKIDADEAKTESPVRYPGPQTPVQVEVGAAERPSFLDQALWLPDHWPAAEVTIAAGRHHFDVIEGLESADTPMLRRVLSLSGG